MNRKTIITLMAGTTGMAAMGAARMLNNLYEEADAGSLTMTTVLLG
jgi:hypothetical protein